MLGVVNAQNSKSPVTVIRRARTFAELQRSPNPRIEQVTRASTTLLTLLARVHLKTSCLYQ